MLLCSQRTRFPQAYMSIIADKTLKNTRLKLCLSALHHLYPPAALTGRICSLSIISFAKNHPFFHYPQEMNGIVKMKLRLL